MKHPVCPAPRCDFGWVSVLESYVDRHCPEPELPEGSGPELDATRAALVLEWKGKRASTASTVYPCRECNGRLFMRWCGGHLAADHDREDCQECETPGQRRRGGKTLTLAAPTPPPVPPNPEEF